MRNRTIEVGDLARVEGEGALRIVVRDGTLKSAELSIFEPPRYFEALLLGRAFDEAPDITARICGICPAAYQMSAVHAMEDALGVRESGPVRDLRRLLMCGEWIESHTLHIHMLHAPDFLGYEGMIDMARDHGDAVRRGLDLKRTGNDLMALIGGREIHPINVRVGGFYRAPSRRALLGLCDSLKRARDRALETVRWVAGFDFPDREHDYVFVSLRSSIGYPLNDGRIVSSRGLDIPVAEFESHIEERQVERSTALQAYFCDGSSYLVGPLARYSLNFDRLPPGVQAAAQEAGLGRVCRNPWRSIIVRALEVLYACEEALRILESYEEPDPPAVPVTPGAGTGTGVTEAPRGLLYHRYRLDGSGRIALAQIIPPTSQNQVMIEDDLVRFIDGFLELPDTDLRLRCEQMVRNHDPCISCATHFLRLDMDRG